MAKPYVILAAGVEYMWGGTSFPLKCVKRAVWLQRKHPDATIAVFDFWDGVLRVSEQNSKGRREGEKWLESELRWVKREEEEFNFTKLKRAYYLNHGLRRDAPDGIMSVLDIYEYVRRLGRGERNVGQPGTLIELSFFSHGFWQGPVLVNSNDKTLRPGDPDWDPVVDTKRDEKDKDPRHRKDFLMTDPQRIDFRKAFAKDAVIWVWGCNGTTDYWTVFDRLSKTPEYKSRKAGKLTDDREIELPVKMLYDRVVYERHKDVFTPRRSGVFVSTLRKLKPWYLAAMKDTYMANAAAFTKVVAHGSFPGMESAIRYTKDDLMEVPTKREQKTVYTPFLEFYTTYLKASEDGEGRHYGKYFPGREIVVSTGGTVLVK